MSNVVHPLAVYRKHLAVIRPNDAGRQAHLNGRVVAALMAKAGKLLSQPPKIEQVDVLAAKLP